jgi:hypothetical protein
MSREIDLALGVLDHQLLDSDERRCGKVDDLELAGLDGPRPRVTEILAGAPAWRGRGVLGRLAAWAGRGTISHVPWSEVAEVESAIWLRGRAAKLRLGRGDDRARRWIERVPRAR